MNKNNSNQDSSADTLNHIKRVQDLLAICCENLRQRGINHDKSKLEEPEKSMLDTCKIKLQNLTYGTPEYIAALEELRPMLAHHYANNSHHPQFYSNGIDGMDLFDIVELLMDWKAATERMRSGGDIRKSLEINTTRFNISPQLKAILANTIERLQW
jgi:hypothetical protein